MSSKAVQRLINTVLTVPSPTGRAWHLSALQAYQEETFSKSLGDTYAKRVLGESDEIIVICSADHPFETVGYEAKPVELATFPEVEPETLPPVKPANYDNNNYYHWVAKWFTFGIGAITITNWLVNSILSLFG